MITFWFYLFKPFKFHWIPRNAVLEETSSETVCDYFELVNIRNRGPPIRHTDRYMYWITKPMS